MSNYNKNEAAIDFEWDEAKNLSNQRKHGVSFEQAEKVFLDPLQISTQDRVENGEERWQTYGLVDGVLLLMVAHTTRNWAETREIVRIISARKSSKKEMRLYEDENRQTFS